MFTKKGLVLLIAIFSSLLLTSCSNSSQESQVEADSDVINEDDYLRFAENSLDAYKIACYAIENDEWIIAAQKWSEGDDLSEQEGKLVARGLTEAMNIRLQEGQSAEWNGEPADNAIKSACATIMNR